MFKEAKKWVGQELSLMELNNIMREITGSGTDIFNYGREYWENFSWCIEDENEIPVGINVDFTILNSAEENDTKIIVRINDVTEL